MRKQYQCFVLILFTGVLFCTNHVNNLNACGTNATACTIVKEKTVHVLKHVPKIEKDNTAETDGSLYMFADPFIYSN